MLAKLFSFDAQRKDHCSTKNGDRQIYPLALMGTKFNASRLMLIIVNREIKIGALF